VLTAIRLATPGPHAELIAYRLFMCVLVCVSAASALVFSQALRTLPTVRTQLERQAAAVAAHAQARSLAAGAPPTTSRACACAKTDAPRVGRILRGVWMQAATAFLVHATSLLLFPGLPCHAPPQPPFDTPRRYLWCVVGGVLACVRCMSWAVARVQAGP
jgi:hypothetical protein